MLKNNLLKVQLKIKFANIGINECNFHIINLIHILEEANVEHLHQTKELEVIQGEHQVLRAQVIE